MREEYRRCRFYPLCEIHLGFPIPVQGRAMSTVDLGERLEIHAQVLSGRGPVDVAREHHLDYRQVRRVVKQIETLYYGAPKKV